MDRLSGDLRILSSPANIKAFFGVDIVLSNFSSFFSFFPVSTITISLFMYFSCANFLHSSPKLACVSTHASVILVDDNSSSIHPVCISVGFIVNLIPTIIFFPRLYSLLFSKAVESITLSNYSLITLLSLIIQFYAKIMCSIFTLFKE